jgi:hypothetical protein
VLCCAGLWRCHAPAALLQLAQPCLPILASHQAQAEAEYEEYEEEEEEEQEEEEASASALTVGLAASAADGVCCAVLRCQHCNTPAR